MSWNNFRWSILTILGLSLMISSGLAGCATAGPVPEIRGVLDQQVAAWNRQDLDGFMNGYWHSAKLVFQSGNSRYDGWEAMRERYKKSYQSDGHEMGQLQFLDIEITPLGSESAFARGRYELKMSDGKKPTGLFTLILRKFPEGWRIIHDHTSG